MLEEKYIVVAYDTYYPSGGLGNIKGIYDTQEEADKKMAEINNPIGSSCPTYDYVEIELLSDLLTYHQGT